MVKITIGKIAMGKIAMNMFKIKDKQVTDVEYLYLYTYRFAINTLLKNTPAVPKWK